MFEWETDTEKEGLGVSLGVYVTDSQEEALGGSGAVGVGIGSWWLDVLCAKIEDVHVFANVKHKGMPLYILFNY